MTPRWSWRRAALVLGVLVCVQGCASGLTIGESLPVGKRGGVGVVVSPDGQVHTRVGVGVGGGQVSVGGTVDLPQPTQKP